MGLQSAQIAQLQTFFDRICLGPIDQGHDRTARILSQYNPTVPLKSIPEANFSQKPLA